MTKLISKCCGSEVKTHLTGTKNDIGRRYFCEKCNKQLKKSEVIPQPIQKEEKCAYCEGLGFRTESIENDVGGGDIEQVECPKCKGEGSIQKEEVKTATEMMVKDMQEEEYYRIKHTPSDTFIDEETRKKIDFFVSVYSGEEFDKDIMRARIEEILKSSLQERDKMWREKIEKGIGALTTASKVTQKGSTQLEEGIIVGRGSGLNIAISVLKQLLK